MIELELKILKLEARLAALEGSVEDIGAGDPAPPLRKAVVGGPGVHVRDGEAVSVVEADPSCDGKLTIKDHGGTVLGAFTANQADDTTVTLPDIPSLPSGRASGYFTFLTDIRYDSGYIHVKTRTVTVTDGFVTAIGAESGWTNKISTSEEDY